MALALYRTYRPGSLAEVIGQEHVTEPLRRALESGRTHHAYLFSGPRGCGKTSTARILARSLNCAQGPTAGPCGECDSCVQLAPNGPGSMDVVELDAATHRGIDDARELREKAIYAPAASRFKIYIVDEAHQLTNEAANALLKLVEEPPAHLRFIFATTEPDKIIPTIRSRTFHYGFRLVSARTLAEHLGAVCRAEGVPAEAAALAVVARAGAGSVRDSLSVLGQLLAGVGEDGLTYADATAALGLTESMVIDDFLAALAQGSAADMFGVVDRVIGAGHDPRRFVTDILDRLRDLIVLRVDTDALAKGLVDVPDDVGQRMATQATSMSLAELSHAADLVSVGLGQIKGATAPRLQLELLCARLALPDPGAGIGSVLSRLERLERTAGAASRPRQQSAHRSGPVGESADAVPPGPSASVAPGSAAPEAGASPAPQAGSVTPGVSTGPRAPVAASGSQGAPPQRPELRSGEKAGAPQAPTRQPQPAGARPADEDAGSGTSIASVRDAWPAVLERLAASSRVAWTAFHAATPVSCSDGALAVAVAEPGNARAIAQRGHDERLRQALIDVLGVDLTIDVLHDPEPASATPGPAKPGAAPRTGGRPAGGRQAGSQVPGSQAAQDPAAQGPPVPVRRPGDVVRAAGDRVPDEPDEPSPDDPDLEVGNASGLALISRELGARPIGEIDHS